MTRFARAHGSKSSNERVPDEATPWNEIKMQLENRQSTDQNMDERTKRSQKVISEQRDSYYHTQTPNTNLEWAAFNDIPSKQLHEPEDAKLITAQVMTTKKRKLKQKTKKFSSQDNLDHFQDADISVASKVEEQSEKKRKTVVDDDIESRNSRLGLDSKSMESDSPDVAKTKSNPTKRKSKSKKSNQIGNGNDVLEEVQNETGNRQQILEEKPSTLDTNVVNPTPVGGETGKLSKRQKRNQKKQRLMNSDVGSSESRHEDQIVPNDRGSSEFDVEGNDWSNKVKFGKRKKTPKENSSDNLTDTKPKSSSKVDKVKNSQTEGIDEKSVVDGEVRDSEVRENGGTLNHERQKQGNSTGNRERKRRKPDEGVTKMLINGNEIFVVKYDGFPVRKEDAEKLQELKKNMIIKGIPRSEINAVMKLERRKAEKALARERKRVCFHCRKSGHNLSDCPELGRDEIGSGICFKCGSGEHTHFECKVTKREEFRFASCFICREQGHIAKQCPDNPKGLYPQGGGCNVCGDVTHLKKDCPDLIKTKENTTVTAHKIDNNLESLDDQRVSKRPSEDSNVEVKNKIIKF